VTLHVPLNSETRGLIDLAKLACYRSTRSSSIARAVEWSSKKICLPPSMKAHLRCGDRRGGDRTAAPNGTGAKLHKHPKVISTPHLGGSTTEALARIANELAEDVTACCSVRPAWAPSTHRSRRSGSGARAAVPRRRLSHGRFFPQFASGDARGSYAMQLQGELATIPSEAFVRAFLSGLLQTTTDRRVSIVNARHRRRARRARRSAAGCRTVAVRGFAARHRRLDDRYRTSVNGKPRIVEAGGSRSTRRRSARCS